jgi:diguanylate cyclase (GGDEF)-like protein/putative nucleotidyltransferase with HDIG domain
LWTAKPIYHVWREGWEVCLLNFIGSASAAGLISLFYERVGFYVFLFTLPIAAIIYQLHRFYIDRFEQAQQHINELNDLYLSTIEALASAVDAKDRYTHGHIRRVQAYATELARCMNIVDKTELLGIKAGALLHDIGKLGIPEYILNKPTVLTESEFEKMKNHPVIGAGMLKGINFPFPVEAMVRFHHERWDGRGYPAGLSGEQIPFGARILSLVDCYDALTTDRPYRSPMTREKVVEFFRRESAAAYDPAVVNAFIENISQIEIAGHNVRTERTHKPDEIQPEKKSDGRQLEDVQPTLNYSRALTASPDIQRELFSIFDFVRADIRCLTEIDILTFMGAKLSKIAEFDAAAFFIKDPTRDQLVARHSVGAAANELEGLSIAIEQKLSGWVAANNQPLLNLPPFPDFVHVGGRAFQMSAIAAIHKDGTVLGALSVYRTEAKKFAPEEFRRIEIVAAQTSIALAKTNTAEDTSQALLDESTGLPNGYQLYLMFDQLTNDAQRYDYPLSFVCITLNNIGPIRNRFGYMSGEEAMRALSGWILSELRQTDLLVRYASDMLIAITPKIASIQAEALKSRIHDKVHKSRFAVRAQHDIELKVSIGTASFPDDSARLDELLRLSDWRMREDRSASSAAELHLRRQNLF